VQYKVFEQFGLNDTTIRSWFNGPALLTWSRGQNEYGEPAGLRFRRLSLLRAPKRGAARAGSHIGGPLPRSWMKQQWNMMKQVRKTPSWPRSWASFSL
jgi:hypothetical protein